MTPGEVKAIAESAAREAVREMLLTLGLDASDPLSTQRGFAIVREIVLDEDYPRDMAHLRKWRRAVEQVETKGLLTAVGMAVAGVVGLLWLGVKSKLGG